MVVDFYKQAFLLTPTMLRKEIVLHLLWCAIEPLQQSHDDFQNFAAEYRDKATVNSQVMVLENYLNRFFGTTNIEIVDGMEVDAEYVYRTNEEQLTPIAYHSEESVPADNEFIVYHSHEQDRVDLIVRAPQGTNETQLKALMREYLFADKTYTIEWI